MITKIKQFINDNNATQAINKVILALSDLKLILNDTQFLSQLEISNRLRQFFLNDQIKVEIYQFLDIIFKLIITNSWRSFIIKRKFLGKTQDAAFSPYNYKFLSILPIFNLFRSQILTLARSDFSKIIINTKLNINIKANDGTDHLIGQLCQSYYCYIYKLASQTTLINEDFANSQDDLMIYFTLSNQCYKQNQKKLFFHFLYFLSNLYFTQLNNQIRFRILLQIKISFLKSINCILE